MKKIKQFLIRCLGKIYPYSLSLKLRGFRNIVYTSCLKNCLSEIGTGTVIEKPCQLMGGGADAITIGSHTCVQSHSVLACWRAYSGISYDPSIKIGDYCSIGEYNHISAINKLIIGNGVLTGRFVIITDNNHGDLSMEDADKAPANRHLNSKGEVSIGNNVWIGDKVSILSGVKIGDNVVIAANSVVTSDIPENCIAAGVPAKVVRKRLTVK